MIYNTINTDLLKLGNPKKFDNEEKYITPLYYNGSELDFSLKNKFVRIEKIEENSYGKEFVTIKSKEYSDVIETIAKKLDVQSPIQSDGSFRATISSKTKSSKPLNDLRDKKFTACISLAFSTVYSDETRKTLPIQLKDLIIIKIINEDLEIDMDKLEEAM
uniref:Putative ssDNA binding protein n=1 Tax=Pichia etchellsii TaxID=28550 RepID=Q9HFH6_PICET|nr:putative ssDNA binding protein [Schwanniomyces etchellsii]